MVTSTATPHRSTDNGRVGESLNAAPTLSIAVVAIGRNEGLRLVACLKSALSMLCEPRVVYVDSGSTDDSVEASRGLGVEVVELDTSVPFTAARARNAGLAKVLSLWPEVDFIQFVDGDCIIAPGWFAAAAEVLRRESEVAVVCGRRRELYPEQSVYNRLCDIEWNTPVGEARAAGGDAMIRADAIRGVEGYNPRVVAAEDDELCVRLRAKGWRVLRIDHEMTAHDAAIDRLAMWWKRSVRAGHGFAQGFAMHGASPERHFAPELSKCWLWGGAAPVLAVGLAVPTYGVSLAALVLIYLLQASRVAKYVRSKGYSPKDAWAYALNCWGAKFAGIVGSLKYVWRKVTRQDYRIIEYK